MEKDEIINFFQQNKIDVQNANASLIVCDLVFEAYAESELVHKVKYDPVIFYIDNRTTGLSFFQFLSDKKIDQVAKNVYLEYQKNTKSLDEKISKHKKLEIQLDKLWLEYKNYKKPLTVKQLLRIYDKFIKIAKEWWYYGSIGEDKGRVIDYEVVEKFQKKQNTELSKAREIVSILSHPEEQSVLNIERADFLNICLAVIKLLKNNNTDKKEIEEILKNPSIDRKINEYIENFFWIMTDYCKAINLTPKLVIEKALVEIAEKGMEGIKLEIKTIKDNFKKIQLEKNKLKKIFKLSEEDEKDIYFAKRTVYWIDRRKAGMMKQFNYFMNFVGDIASRYNKNYDYLSNYTVKEIRKLIETNKFLSENTIKKRESGNFLIVCEKEKEAQFFYGKNAGEMFKKAIHCEEKTLKGTVASTGGLDRIRGIARIVYNPSDSAFKTGEILVTSMTRVEFIPLMRKARAIIANEGGLACHAAIVSRELGIPCVIGTKIATKILKDGDSVTINLSDGTVKIME